MQLLNKNTDYALRALIFIATSKDRWVSSRKISKNQGIPLPFMRRLLQVLVKARYVESKEGAHGGIKLLKDPRKIKLNDVLALFQGKLQLSECMFRNKICPQRPRCVLRKRISAIEDLVIEKFADITIDTLLNDLKRDG